MIAPHPHTLSGRSIPALWISAALAAGYAYTLFWFAGHNFYYTRFFDHGHDVTFYQAMRLVFMGYLAWLIYAAGMGMLTLCRTRSALRAVAPWERYLLAFLTGAGMWHLLLFATGLAGGYTKPVAASLTLVVMALSIPHLAGCLHGIFEAMRPVPGKRTPLQYLLLYAVLAVTVAAFLLTKGTYPAGGHDYYNHYFAFYKQVTQTGSILPGEVWYHFYYSKGAGLYFLAMLLTDPLAPQLVASVFFLSGACMVFALLRRACASSLLPLAGAILYIAFFIYTPGPASAAINGGWGDLEKPHELTAVLMLGMVWIASHLFTHDTASARPWMLALQSVVFTAVLLTLPLAVLAGVYMGLLLVWFLWRRERDNAWRAGATMATAAGTFFIVALINYYYTGLPSDQLLLPFWSFANLQTLRHWGVLFEAMDWHRGLTEHRAMTLPWSWNVIPLTATFLRLDIWWPFAVGALPVLAYRLYKKAARRESNRALWPPLGAYVLAVIIFALFAGGRSQHVSFYRFSSFSYGPMLCIILLFWHSALAPAQQELSAARTRKNALASILFFAALVTAVIIPLHIKSFRSFNNVRFIFANASDLWSGHFSLKDAYRNQQGWPGRMPWGGIYPGIETPWKIVGPNTRIWSFHVHSYCMLPDCNIQEFFSMRFSPHWQTVYFDTPAHGATALRAEGLDYFFFSGELDLRDPVASAPLFSPGHIGENLAIRWTDGTSYLLTWPGPDTHPIDQAFLDAYSKAVRHSSAVQDFPFEAWKAVSDHINRHAKDLRPFRLPWCTTCDYFPIQPLD